MSAPPPPRRGRRGTGRRRGPPACPGWGLSASTRPCGSWQLRQRPPPPRGRALGTGPGQTTRGDWLCVERVTSEAYLGERAAGRRLAGQAELVVVGGDARSRWTVHRRGAAAAVALQAGPGPVLAIAERPAHRSAWREVRKASGPAVATSGSAASSAAAERPRSRPRVPGRTRLMAPPPPAARGSGRTASWCRRGRGRPRRGPAAVGLVAGEAEELVGRIRDGLDEGAWTRGRGSGVPVAERALAA